MITYGFSIQGKGHIQRGIVCQDSSIAERIRSGHYVGIVADGVGDAKHADIGSGIAVKSLLQYCNEHIQKSSSTDHIEDVLADGYDFAFRQIVSEAARREAAIREFDTTLSVAVYSSQSVVYGHSGDGGIIAKYTDGKMGALTSRQKGEDATSVIPLRAGRSSWVFGTEENVAAVLLATDGMLDGVLQPLLLNQPSSRMALTRGNFRRNHVYVTAAEFYMNPDSVYRNRSVKDPDKYMRTFLQGELDGDDEKPFLQCIYTAYMKQLGKQGTDRVMERMKKYLYAVKAVSEVTDDKSIVCIMDEDVSVKAQDIGYYEEPEWEMLIKKYEEFLYGKTEPPIPPKKKENKTEGNPPAPPVTPPATSPVAPSEPSKKGSKRARGGKLPAILISLAAGCLLGSMITFALISVFRSSPDTGREAKQPAVRQETTQNPIATGKSGQSGSRTENPGATGKSESESEASETELEESAEQLLQCLLQLDGLTLSKSDKEKVQEAITEYRFSEYMKILKAETNNSYNNFEPSDTEDEKKVDSLTNDLIKIMRKIWQNKKQKVQDEKFKSILKNLYGACTPDDKNKISRVSKELTN